MEMFYFNSSLQEIFKIAKLRMSDRRPCYSPAGQTVTVVVPHIGRPMVIATGFDPNSHILAGIDERSC